VREHLSDRLLHGCAIGDITVYGKGFSAGSHDARDGFRGAFGVDVNYGDARALAREFNGRFSSKTGSCSGDENDFAGQTLHGASSIELMAERTLARRKAGLW
jgi:hypothetical protein